MFKRILFFIYGSLSYLIFLGTFLYAVCFVGNFGVARTLDGAASGSLAISLAIDAGLLTLFAVQHHGSQMVQGLVDAPCAAAY